MRTSTISLGRGGFALPVAVLGLVVVGVLVTGGFYVARQEARISLASEGGTQAFYVAEKGIADVLAHWDAATYGNASPWTPVTVSDSTHEGTWTVRITRMTDQLYFLDSQGAAPVQGRSGPEAGPARASRRVGTVARVLSRTIDPAAALTTLGEAVLEHGTEVDGSDVRPRGWDAVCTAEATDKPAVRTVGAGDARDQHDDALVPGDLAWSDVIARADLRLAGGVLEGVAPTLDASGGCNVGDPMNWGDPRDPAAPCGGHFPIVHVNGSATLPSGGLGQGILAVDGDLRLDGGFHWNGLVLVRGSLVAQGVDNRVLGAVVARDARLSDAGRMGNPVVRHSTCAIGRSILLNGALTRARPLDRRGWVDLSAVMP